MRITRPLSAIRRAHKTRLLRREKQKRKRSRRQKPPVEEGTEAERMADMKEKAEDFKKEKGKDPLTNENGVYNKEDAGERYEKIDVPFKKNTKWRAEIGLAQGTDDLWRSAPSMSKLFGSYHGTGSPVTPSDTGYETREEALRETFDKIQAFMEKDLRDKDSFTSKAGQKQTTNALKQLKDFREKTLKDARLPKDWRDRDPILKEDLEDTIQTYDGKELEKQTIEKLTSILKPIYHAYNGQIGEIHFNRKDLQRAVQHKVVERADTHPADKVDGDIAYYKLTDKGYDYIEAFKIKQLTKAQSKKAWDEWVAKVDVMREGLRKKWRDKEKWKKDLATADSDSKNMEMWELNQSAFTSRYARFAISAGYSMSYNEVGGVR